MTRLVPRTSKMLKVTSFDTFDNPRSIGIKCQYIKDQKYLGMMFWHYDADTVDGTLRNAAAEGLK